MQDTEIPQARVVPSRRNYLLWLFALLALLLGGILVYQFQSQRGPLIQVTLKQGHGIKAGDALRYRGIVVGRVASVLLAASQKNIQVSIQLSPQAASLAKAGSRYWIVRPQLELSGITGLDTLLGAKYIAVSPGNGPERLQFVGLEEAPLIENSAGRGLELILQSSRKGSLRPGMPIRYRGISVGTIISVALARDASAVEARAYIAPDYLPLVQAQTRFWRSGGMQLQGGLTGFSFRLDSMQAWLNGGVSFATPPDGGEKIHNGHRFTLFEDAEEDWLDWQPSLILSDVHLKKGKSLPQPHRALLSWQHQVWWLRQQTAERQAWLLPVAGGWLGPLTFFQAPEKAEPGSVSLEVAGRNLDLSNTPQALGAGIGLLADPHTLTSWPTTTWRIPTGPEDCLVIGDPRTPPRVIAAARFTSTDALGWTLDPALSFGESWMGASVIAVQDGRLIGLLMSDSDGDKIIPISVLPKH